MFTTNHFIWLAVCAVCIAAGLGYLINRRPRLSSVLTAFCLVCIASECVKVLSCIEMVPGKDGQTMYPYLPLAHLPFHLCSIQIAFIFYTRFSHNERLRTALLAFMYPSCLAGALLALLMPSIVPGSVAVEDMFRAPLAYQYFLYHSALIVLGAYIPLSGEVDIKPKTLSLQPRHIAGFGLRVHLPQQRLCFAQVRKRGAGGPGLCYELLFHI